VTLPDPIVDAVGVVKHFGSVHALDGVSITVPRGVVYGLLGPNGAGKTTLIRVLATLLRPDAGAARVAGVDVVADPEAARRKIGLAGQFAAVDDFLTGRENVEMIGRLYHLPPGEARRRATDVLGRFDLLDAADRPVRTYSGGMRRRLDLAASLVGRPEVMFLDEPTTGVDPRSRIDIWDLIRDLVAEGVTILLTTQYLDEADQLASRIGVIDRGRLVSEGTPDELKDEIGGSVVQLAVHPEGRAAAAATLATVAGAEPTVDHATGRLSIPAAGSQTLLAVVRALDAAGIEPDDLELRKPTLDDVFLALTGHAAEEAPLPNGRRRRRRSPERAAT